MNEDRAAARRALEQAKAAMHNLSVADSRFKVASGTFYHRDTALDAAWADLNAAQIAVDAALRAPAPEREPGLLLAAVEWVLRDWSYKVPLPLARHIARAWWPAAAERAS